jgi:hypothetical protein
LLDQLRKEKVNENDWIFLNTLELMGWNFFRLKKYEEAMKFASEVYHFYNKESNK